PAPSAASPQGGLGAVLFRGPIPMPPVRLGGGTRAARSGGSSGGSAAWAAAGWPGGGGGGGRGGVHNTFGAGAVPATPRTPGVPQPSSRADVAMPMVTGRNAREAATRRRETTGERVANRACIGLCTKKGLGGAAVPI